MEVEHVWVVDFEPVTDAPVPVGLGASERSTHVPASAFDVTDDDDDVGENRNGLAVVITNGIRRIEVGRIAFKAELKRRSQFERKLRDIVDTIAQPACDARNNAEKHLAQIRAEAEVALRAAQDRHQQRINAAEEALRRVQNEPIKHWDAEAFIEAEAPDGD
jgi:hypothetical protein